MPVRAFAARSTSARRRPGSASAGSPRTSGRVAQSLREQGKEGPAKLAEQAADRAQRVGSWLEGSDGDQIIGDVEDFARRNPWAVALGGLALGLRRIPRAPRVQFGALPVAQRRRLLERDTGRPAHAAGAGGAANVRAAGPCDASRRPRGRGTALMTTPRDPDGLREQSVGDLLKQLSQETSTLVRQEMALARAEMTEKGKRAGMGAGMLGGAGVAALLTLGALTACLILVLNEWMDAWLAALILTVVWAVIAGVLALQGRTRSRRRRRRYPSRPSKP